MSSQLRLAHRVKQIEAPIYGNGNDMYCDKSEKGSKNFSFGGIM